MWLADKVYARELFPGCPPPPFLDDTMYYGLTRAHDADCPRPCAIRAIDGAGHAVVTTQRYDDAGHWIDGVSASSYAYARVRSYGDHYCRRDGRTGDCSDTIATEAKLTYDEAGDLVVVDVLNGGVMSPTKLTYEHHRIVRGEEAGRLGDRPSLRPARPPRHDRVRRARQRRAPLR